MPTTKELKARGYTCRREWLTARGYWGGGNLMAYVVRDPAGKVVDPVGTARTARSAWAWAASIVATKEGA